MSFLLSHGQRWSLNYHFFLSTVICQWMSVVIDSVELIVETSFFKLIGDLGMMGFTLIFVLCWSMIYIVVHCIIWIEGIKHFHHCYPKKRLKWLTLKLLVHGFIISLENVKWIGLWMTRTISGILLLCSTQYSTNWNNACWRKRWKIRVVQNLPQKLFLHFLLLCWGQSLNVLQPALRTLQ